VGKLTPKRLMKRFRRYKGLLFCISSAFAVDWKCEPEEPYSLSLVLFTQACYEYDESRCDSFKKFLAFWVRRGLSYEQKRRVREAKHLRLLHEGEEVEHRYHSFDLSQFLESLSEDGREIVRAALNKGGLSPGTGGRTRGVARAGAAGTRL
jgi:hypothetical protein